MAYMDKHPRPLRLSAGDLPNGTFEASALPAVMINCAVCLPQERTRRGRRIPGRVLSAGEEYDLSFRLWQAGYRIERFEDLLYRHEKVGGNRSPGVDSRLDTRNNLILVERFLPAGLRQIYRHDWALRYDAIARHAGHRGAAWRGRLQAVGGRCARPWPVARL